MAYFFRSSHTKKNVNNLIKNLDRIKTDSRRFKPNSRIILLDEQSNLLQRLHHKEMTNRHRGRNH